MANDVARREFLRFILASPLLAPILAESVLADEDSPAGFARQLDATISSPDGALDVFDLQRAAEDILPPAHYGYIATGTDGNETLHANRKAFEKVYLRPSRMVDTRAIDTRLELLGQELSSPIALAPAGSQNAFHADGEIAAANAARTRDHLLILSNVSTRSIEDVTEARAAPVWFQLYPTSNWSITKTMLERAEKAGSPVVVLTVDMNANSNRVPLGHYVREDTRDCSQCHDASADAWLDRKPMYSGTNVRNSEFLTPGMTWEFVARLRESTSMKVVVKGIVTGEDAKGCLQHGADAVYVSNHGGRAEASGRGALDSLPEVVAAVDGQVPILVDSGFRRGTDIYKAMAMGADVVCVGRPYLWGLAAFGQPGVEKVLDILNRELAMVMGQMGTPTLADIGPQSIGK